MGEEEAKKVEQEVAVTPQKEEETAAEEKSVIPVSSVPDHKDSDSKPSPADEKAIVPVPPPPPVEKKAPEKKAPEKKTPGTSNDRDAELIRLEQEKKLALVKAWEDNEKTKALNKACKKLSAIESWEKSNKANAELQLRRMEEKLEKQKAEFAEKMKNKVGELHKQAEERRAMVEALKGEELMKAEELAAKYRATGHVPKKFLGCFGG